MRLIDADRLIKIMQAWHGTLEKEYTCNDSYVQGYGAALDAVENAPIVEKQEVKRGFWRAISESEMTGWNPEFAGCDPVGNYVCSACGKEAIFSCNDEWVLSEYCPHCGAKME